jgi:protein-disulfide isomerase
MKHGLKPPVSDKDHIQGNRYAEIELVEYGDFQCPYCGQAYPIVKIIQQKLGNHLKFIFRNFPLSEIHPQARLAAVASEAAAKQNKFWEMHHIMFENQHRLYPSDLIEYANELGLDGDQFQDDATNDDLIEKVEADFESGVRSGVNGTPTFFINGEKYNDSWDEDTLESYLKSKISSQRQK